MKKIVNKETHYIVYAVYKDKNLQEKDFNDADWYETLKDAIDAVDEIRKRTFYKRANSEILSPHYGPIESYTVAEIMAVDVGPSIEQWTAPVKIDNTGWRWSDDLDAIKALKALGITK